MGPANDYWPADLGGTTRARPVHTLMYARVYERQGTRLALAAPPRRRPRTVVKHF
jgi:hypothetical protein